MKIILSPTDQFQMLNGLPVRVWSGTTDRGTAIVAQVVSVGCEVANTEGRAELMAVLGANLPEGLMVSFVPTEIEPRSEEPHGNA